MAEVRLILSPLSSRKLRCDLELIDEGGQRHPPAQGVLSSFEAARHACSAATPGGALVVDGVVARRRHMGGHSFVDLVSGGAAEGPSLQVVVNAADLDGSSLRGLSLSLLLRRHSRLRVAGTPGRTRSGEPSLFARSLRLLRLPADPACVLKAARLVATCADLPAEAAAEALGCVEEELYEIVHELEAADGGAELLGPSEAPAAAQRLARALSARLRRQGAREAGPGLRGRRRERPPRFSAAELALLRRLSAAHSEWHPIFSDQLAPLAEVGAALSGPLALERGLPDGLPAAELEMRMRYYHEKKVPQLRWMLHQARALLGGRQTAAVPSSDAEPLVIDLGCGKGDFALLLAAAMPQLRVLGIDANADAVTYASERALAAGLTNTCFRVADAASLEAAPPAASAAPPAASAAPPAASAAAALPSEHDGGAVASLREWHAADGAELVVALHACGGLSDVALGLAAKCGASCLVCTCCFGKHRRLCAAREWGLPCEEEEKDVLCRMADCVEDSISDEARRVISSLRLERLRRTLRPSSTLVRASIRTFPRTFSRQNVVLGAECAPCAPVF